MCLFVFRFLSLYLSIYLSIFLSFSSSQESRHQVEVRWMLVFMKRRTSKPWHIANLCFAWAAPPRYDHSSLWALPGILTHETGASCLIRSLRCIPAAVTPGNWCNGTQGWRWHYAFNYLRFSSTWLCCGSARHLTCLLEIVFSITLSRFLAGDWCLYMIGIYLKFNVFFLYCYEIFISIFLFVFV